MARRRKMTPERREFIKHHLFLSMSLTHFIILSFLSQCKKDLEKFQGYRYLLQRTIQI